MFTFDKLFILDLSDYEEIVENNIYLLFSTISYLIIIVSFISKSPRKTPDDGNPVPEHRSDSNLRNAEILYRLRIYRSYPVFFPGRLFGSSPISWNGMATTSSQEYTPFFSANGLCSNVEYLRMDAYSSEFSDLLISRDWRRAASQVPIQLNSKFI